jgi:hypothetical protein
MGHYNVESGGAPAITRRTQKSFSSFFNQTAANNNQPLTTAVHNLPSASMVNNQRAVVVPQTSLKVDLSEDEMKFSELTNAPLSSRNALMQLKAASGSECLRVMTSYQ